MVLHILQFFLSVRIVNGRDLHQSLDQVCERSKLLCIRSDHIAAYKDRIRESISGLIRDHPVASLKYIAVKV